MERKKIIQIATVVVAILGLPLLLLFYTMGKSTPMAEKIDHFLFFYFPFFLSLMTLGSAADAIYDFLRKKHLLGVADTVITAACLWLTVQAGSNFLAWKDYKATATSREETPQAPNK